MIRVLTSSFALVVLLASLPPSPAAVDEKGKENRNTLITRYKDKLKLAASSTWEGWPLEKLIDGDAGTSWFSAAGDTSTLCKTPWVEVEFPEDVTISRVTLLGNREVAFPNGFGVLLGRLELFDADGKRLSKQEEEGVGAERDFDFALKRPIKGVRKVRFTSLKDEGDKNGYNDIGIAEIQIE